MSATNDVFPGSPGANDLTGLAARVAELEQRAAALTAALERTRRTRRMIVIAFLVFVVFSGQRFYGLARMVQSDAYKQRLVAELQKSVNNNQDDFSKEAQKLVDGITPVVRTAFVSQAEKDMPLFMQTFDKERETLMTGLPLRLSKRVENHHHDMLRKHEKLIAAEFPSVQDPKVRDLMMNNTCIALDRLVKKYYVDEFEKEFKTMSVSWNDFPPAAAPAKGDPPLTDELLGQLMDLLAIKMSRHPHAMATK